MWVIRAGQEAVYFDKILSESKIFIPWEGYRLNLQEYLTLKEFRPVVEKEKKTNNRTTISNWSGQLFSFVNQMNIGDYVLIPAKRSQAYILAKISGEYKYDESEPDGLHHSRNISIICKGIPKTIFPQTILYSLGTYRTLFKVKQEEEVLTYIKKWRRKEQLI